MTRAIQDTIFIYFGQVIQKLSQYECNLTTFWHWLLPNMVIPLDSGLNLSFLCLKSYFPLYFRKSHQML